MSLSEKGNIKVLEDSFSDHSPILVTLPRQIKDSGTNLKTVYRRDISRIVVSEFEDVLQTKDWSPIYNTNDPNEAVSILLSHVKESLDVVAPYVAIKIRHDKTDISLKRDTLAAMAS